MFNFLNAEGANPTPQQIARSFRWLGWIGLGLQALLGFIPIFVVTASALFRPGQSQFSGISLGLWMAIACLIVLVFSIYWCFHYTRLGNRLETRNQRPAKAQIIKDLKLGLLANIGIMSMAVVIALTRVGELTFRMMTLPPGATVIAPNQTGTVLAQGAMVTPSNMIAIQAMINAIAAGLVGAVVALLLLYQVNQHRSPQD